ncbi:MAG: insulinase family protein [Chloroflexi bacterium]|nr:insulinase family protein [Chloroflexota bacterium]
MPKILPLATPELITLANGLRLLVTPMPYARSVSASIYVAAGSRFEATPEEGGLSHFLEHLLFKGTERRPKPLDISMEIDRIGGNINAATNREMTVYYAKVTPEYLGGAIDILGDMIRNSMLPEHEIERERDVILEELAAVEDSPTEQVGVLLDETLWPGQPHGRDIAGTEESVEAMTAEAIRAYYHRQYVPNATVVSIAGAVDPSEVREMVGRAFEDWRAGDPLPLVPNRPGTGHPLVTVHDKETEQVHLSFGLHGVASNDDDRYAFDLLSVILGEGMSSRLFARLREELALCYDIHSYMATLHDCGMFGVYAGVDPERAVEAAREIAKELARACIPVGADELERAKAVSRSRTQLRLEDTRSVSALYGSQAILNLPMKTPEETLARSAAVTIEEAARVAARVIRGSALHIAAVGPVDAAALQSAVVFEP